MGAVLWSVVFHAVLHNIQPLQTLDILNEYAANFIYKPGYIHSKPDALLGISVLNTIIDTDVLYVVLCRAYQTSTDWEFLLLTSLSVILSLIFSCIVG